MLRLKKMATSSSSECSMANPTLNPAHITRPIHDLAADVRAGKVSAVELAAASLARIKATEDYHAVLELNTNAIEEAAAVDARVKAGEDLPLAGIPFAAKDNYLTLGGT